jgi:hypothetical protein
MKGKDCGIEGRQSHELLGTEFWTLFDFFLARPRGWVSGEISAIHARPAFERQLVLIFFQPLLFLFSFFF